MFSYSQANRPMKVKTPLAPDTLLLVGFEGREGVSELFRFELELLATNFAGVPFEKLVGQPISVELALPNGMTRTFSGIVSRLSQGSRDDTFTQYRAEMVPRFWLWTLRAQSRIFQQKTVPEILAAVLDGLDVSFELTGSYPARDYCAQYRETDFAFASRLMEEEGIYYYFQHSEEGHRTAVTDSSFQLPDVPELSTVLFESVGEGLRDDVRVRQWQKTQQVCSTRHTLWDHCFELPGQNLEAAEGVQQEVSAGTVEHKLAPRGPRTTPRCFPATASTSSAAS